MDLEDQKRQVAEHAVQFIEPHLKAESIVGVGTGTTANYFIDALAAIKHKFDGAVSSSVASETRLKSHGIPVYDLNGVADVGFYVDGADESNHRLELIKGRGGALTREKIVASVAETFICIADASKLVDILGAFPLPVEVIPMARSAVARQLVALGGRPVYREGYVTDNGNVILDVHDFVIEDPCTMEARINNIVGVVTNGLFALRPADVLILGGPDAVTTRRAADAR